MGSGPSNLGLHVYSGWVGIGPGLAFGPGGNSQITADGTPARIFINADYSITGGAGQHYAAIAGGMIDNVVSRTVTLTGIPSYTLGFATAQAGGMLFLQNMTFSGSASATTVRYLARANGIISTATGSAGTPNSGRPTYFPGGIPGTIATGGVYY
jgi:hypothetical protein